MAVSIEIIGHKSSEEFSYASKLKEKLLGELQNHEGKILLIPSARLFGQKVKDVDLIILGNLKFYKLGVKTKIYDYANKQELPTEPRNVVFKNFCYTVEIKSHDAHAIKQVGTQILVRYDNEWHDASTQSDNQNISLRGYFKDNLKYSPYVSNFIWFTNLSKEGVKQLVGFPAFQSGMHNVLHRDFSIRDIFELSCAQKMPVISRDENNNLKDLAWSDCLLKSDSFVFDDLKKVFNLFEEVRKAMGDLTRKKIEQITSRLLNEQQYAKGIGEKLTIIAGRAGTGKTIKLLRIACDLAINHGKRCLILTFNHALVSDIKRTLALADIPDGIDNYTVNISTLHKFYYELINGFGAISESDNFLNDYERLISELIQYINEGLIEQKDIQNLMRRKHEEIAWDYIFIDEAQDWTEGEKTLIYKVFGHEKIIVSDGLDQMIRSNRKCNWQVGLHSNQYNRTAEKKGLRQKLNLVKFINSFAQEVGLNWSIDPLDDFTGGRVIVKVGSYTQSLHEKEKNKCIADGNTGYEMLFLVPPSLVFTMKKEKSFHQIEVERKFLLSEEFNANGIKIWDGTDQKIRSQYPVSLDEHRLFQFDSCRGLEGWTVICMELDSFYKYRMDTYEEDQNSGELALETFEEKRSRFVNLWTLIPLTRAIDTLIITIKDPNSEIAKILNKVHQKNRDIITWID
jgi:hypothetical protein